MEGELAVSRPPCVWHLTINGISERFEAPTVDEVLRLVDEYTKRQETPEAQDQGEDDE